MAISDLVLPRVLFKLQADDDYICAQIYHNLRSQYCNRGMDLVERYAYQYTFGVSN